MNHHIEEHEIILKTVGPVFIGSGKEIGKKEYILKANGSIIVIDIGKLYGLARKKGLTSKLEAFFLTDARSDLATWTRENRISGDELEACSKYQIRQTDSALARGTRIQVMEFVKDAYGLPYVPGSSIKGMLRTILLADDMIHQPRKYDQNRKDFDQALDRNNGKTNRNTFLKREQKSIEERTFNTLGRDEKKPSNAVNDNMSGIIISDSKPLRIEDLVLCQRVEQHANGTEKTMNVLRECIKPGTDISFTLTIDKTLSPYSLSDILRAIETFATQYQEVFRSKFETNHKLAPNTVYLGGGVGFVSKTNVYPLFGAKEGLERTVDIFFKTNVPPLHKHNRDRQIGVSPHVLKMTKYEGKKYEMGECVWVSK